MLAAATGSLFFRPATTSPSPLISGSRATLAASAFGSLASFGSSMPARAKNPASVGPGIET
jgi:hypothetical protein